MSELQVTCECCGENFDKLDDYGECKQCAKENTELARVMDLEEFPELEFTSFEAKIICGECGNIKTVGGYIWHHRLSSSRKDNNGNYLGWNCDRCADRIEAGMGY